MWEGGLRLGYAEHVIPALAVGCQLVFKSQLTGKLKIFDSNGNGTRRNECEQSVVNCGRSVKNCLQLLLSRITSHSQFNWHLRIVDYSFDWMRNWYNGTRMWAHSNVGEQLYGIWIRMTCNMKLGTAMGGTLRMRTVKSCYLTVDSIRLMFIHVHVSLRNLSHESTCKIVLFLIFLFYPFISQLLANWAQVCAGHCWWKIKMNVTSVCVCAGVL